MDVKLDYPIDQCHVTRAVENALFYTSSSLRARIDEKNQYVTKITRYMFPYATITYDTDEEICSGISIDENLMSLVASMSCDVRAFCKHFTKTMEYEKQIDMMYRNTVIEHANFDD